MRPIRPETPPPLRRWTRLDTVAVGDRFLIRPGQNVATDGRVIDGTSAVDESAVTGESTTRFADRRLFDPLG